MVWQPRRNRTRGSTGTGSSTSNGAGIDTQRTVAGTARIFDVRGVSRPLAVHITVASGDTVDMATTTVVAALSDANHAGWTVTRAASGANSIEQITSSGVLGVRVRRVSGSGNSTARLYAVTRGPNYNPAYSPSYNVAFTNVNDVRRVMRQAGFGERYGEAATLFAAGTTAGAWFDTKWNEATTPMPFVQGATINDRDGDNDNQWNMRSAWTARSQQLDGGSLHWRLVWATHQIWTVGRVNDTERGSTPQTWNATRHNEIIRSGTVRDILQHVTEDFFTGWFLNNFYNDGRRSGVDLEPNQNFVRELCQLYSLGQIKLNLDGTPALVGGQTVKTYTRDDILNLARLFSGFRGLKGSTGWKMAFDGAYHYRGPAIVTGFGGIGRGQLSTNPTEAEAMVHVNAALDYLAYNDTTAAYICKQLITLLVTDNPTPAYMRRVTAAYKDNGFGVVGEFKAIFRAIILDPEARGDHTTRAAGYGRHNDWFLSQAARCRVGEAATFAETPVSRVFHEFDYETNGYESGNSNNALIPLAQEYGRPPSVFSYYPFDRSLSSTFVAPASALITASAILGAWKTMVASAWSNVDGGSFVSNPTAGRGGRFLLTNLLADSPTDTVLIDRVIELLLCGRTLPAAARTDIINMMATLVSAEAASYAGGTTVNRQRRAVTIIAAVAMQPEALEQV